MKYLHQAVILAAVTAAAELIKYLVPLPVPASIYGLLLLFLPQEPACRARAQLLGLPQSWVQGRAK